MYLWALNVPISPRCFLLAKKESGAHLLNCWVECGDHDTLSPGWVVCISECGVGKACPGGFHDHLSPLLSLPPAVLLLLLPDCLFQDPVLSVWPMVVLSALWNCFFIYALSKLVPLDQKLLTQMPAGAREMMWILERCQEAGRDGIECSEVGCTYSIWGQLPLASFPTIRTWPWGC